jgi:hypothetical protein
MGVLGLTQKIHFKVPPFLGVTVGAAVVVGCTTAVVVTTGLVVAVVVDVDPQLMTNEVQINRIRITKRTFFTVFPPFIFP